MNDTLNGENKRPTLTVALPAYNEENTIEFVLHKLLNQSTDTFILDRIVVYSDGCTDNTVKLVKRIQKSFPKIHLVESPTRKGKIYQVNRMFKDCTSDLLMVLDADLGFNGDNFLNLFVLSTLKDTKSVMFAAHQVPLRPKGLIASTCYASFLMWDYVRLSVPDKNHVQNFYSAATIFRKRFLEKAQIPDETNEMRTFLYLMAKRNGGFRYVDEAVVLYWPPSTINDFLSLRTRAFGSDEKFIRETFGEEFKNANTIPFKYKVKGIVKFFLKHPFFTLPALALNLWISIATKITQREQRTASAMWNIVSSTKKMAKKHVIFSTFDDRCNPIYGGGGAIAIHEVSKRLADTFNITVITGNYPGAKEMVVDGVKYERIGFSFFPGKFGQLLYHLFLPLYLMFKNYDIWVESLTPPFSTSFTPLFTNKPVIALVHMLSGEDMSRKYHVPFSFIENFGLTFYRYFVVLTKNSAQKISQKNFSATIKIIGNGVTMPVVHKNTSKEKYIAYLGRIEIDQKGLDLLIEAHAKTLERHRIPLLIAGSGSEKEITKLKYLIKRHNMKSLVRVVGRLDGEEKSNFLQNALVGIIPSRYETFSLTLLEMMSYGLPVISFEIPGIEWAPANTVLRVPSFDTDALSSAINKMIEQQNFREETSAAAQKYAMTHTWGDIALQYKQYIVEVLEKEDKKKTQHEY